MADEAKQTWMRLDLPEGSPAHEAIERWGLLTQFQEIDLETSMIGIHGRLVKLDSRLSEGHGVEIDRPITAAPEPVPRRDQSGQDADD